MTDACDQFGCASGTMLASQELQNFIHEHGNESKELTDQAAGVHDRGDTAQTASAAGNFDDDVGDRMRADTFMQ